MDEKSKSEVGSDQERLYTMRELNQDTAGVMHKINKDGRPALVTRHGRLIAAILPLASSGLESELVDRYLSDLENYQQFTGERTMEGLASTADVAEHQGVRLPRYPSRDAFDSGSQ